MDKKTHHYNKQDWKSIPNCEQDHVKKYLSRPCQKMYFKTMSKNVCQDQICQDHVCQGHFCQDLLVLYRKLWQFCFAIFFFAYFVLQILFLFSEFFFPSFWQYVLTTCFDKIQFDPIRSNLIQFDPIWSIFSLLIKRHTISDIFRLKADIKAMFRTAWAELAVKNKYLILYK